MDRPQHSRSLVSRSPSRAMAICWEQKSASTIYPHPRPHFLPLTRDSHTPELAVSGIHSPVWISCPELGTNFVSPRAIEGSCGKTYLGQVKSRWHQGVRVKLKKNFVYHIMKCHTPTAKTDATTTSSHSLSVCTIHQAQIPHIDTMKSVPLLSPFDR